MDGKGRQELKNYILVFLALALCITAASYALARQEENQRREQISELVKRYPEMESDIIRIMEKEAEDAVPNQENGEILERMEQVYGYQFDRSIADHRMWKSWGIFIAAAGAAFGILWAISGRKKVRQETAAADRQMKLEEALKEAENHVEDMREQYGIEEENTKALITNISHQLKTPLASLRMSHELVVSDYLTEKEKQEFLEREGIEIDKLQTLLGEMMKVSHLEKHMISIKPEKNSLRDTVSEAVAVVYPKAAAKSIRIQVEMEEDVHIRHDAHWTAEAFANILDNGVKYAGKDTEICIRVEKIGHNVLLEFMDEGTGIPDEEKHKIYQRFYRGKNSRGIDGAGVGLYLTRQILEEQGGSIMVKNRQPAGSIFRVLLPMGLE